MSARLVRALANPRLQLVLLLVLALLVRLALHYRAPAFVGKDSQSYFLPGWSIANFEPFELGQRRTPGYPFFIALTIWTLGEELRSLALAQHILGVGTVALTYLVGRLASGHVAGLLAGALVAISGPLLIYERYVMSETLFTFLLTATVALTILASRSTSWRYWGLAGVTLGLAVLTRPVAQVLIPIFLLTAIVSSRRSWRSVRSAVLPLLLGLLMVQLPWMVRNAIEKGNLSASTFGRTLIARTAYYDRGFVFDPPCRPDADPELQQARRIIQEGARQRQSDGVIAGRIATELGLDPVQRNRVMRDVAVGAILCDPLHFVDTTLRFSAQIFVGVEERLRDHWEEWKDANPWDPRTRHLVGPATPFEERERPNASRLVGWYQPVRQPTALLLLAIAGVALGALRARNRPLLLAAAIVITVLTTSAALDGPVERYRYPVDPLIAVLVASGACGLPLIARGLARRPRRP